MSIDQHDIILPVLPEGKGWIEAPIPMRCTRAFKREGFQLLSSVEAHEEGPYYHVSISKGRGRRCTSNEANWVMSQVPLDGWEEDNHVPGGFVRNFWRAVDENLVGRECPCKKEEPVVVEDKGGFV